tara:strand:- start:341 stop:907 length:567 start_codon:yes stop_codon:yes gene_type:complete
MQPDPWSGVEPEHKSAESSLEGSVSMVQNNFNGQIIMLQPPSGSAKVIGILLIIYGAFNALSLLMSIVGFMNPTLMEEMGYSFVDVILLVISSLVATLTSIIGGYWMTNYKRKGVHLVLAGLLVGFLLQVVMSFSDSTQDMYSQFGLEDSTVTALVVGIQAACAAVCALIVAIPLMVANNGLDDSKLF